jgi:hypothetical protein
VAVDPVRQPDLRGHRRGRALVFIRGSKPASRPRIDVSGALLGGLGVFLIVFGFAHAETAGWSAALTVGSLVLGVLLIGAFALAEGRVRAPLLPLRVILDRTRAGPTCPLAWRRSPCSAPSCS